MTESTTPIWVTINDLHVKMTITTALPSKELCLKLTVKMLDILTEKLPTLKASEPAGYSNYSMSRELSSPHRALLTFTAATHANGDEASLEALAMLIVKGFREVFEDVTVNEHVVRFAGTLGGMFSETLRTNPPQESDL